MQGFIGVVGFLIFCMIYCWFPETSQPGSRGIDKKRAESGGNAKDHFYLINPLRPLLLLRSPNLFLIVSTRRLRVEIVPKNLVLSRSSYLALYCHFLVRSLPPFLSRM